METPDHYSQEPESHLDDITLEQNPVTKNIRFVNNIIDIIVIYALAFATGYILGTVGLAEYLNTAISQIIFLGLMFLYYFLMEKTTGRTIGKFVTRTKVVSTDGNTPTTKQIAQRSLARLVPFEAFSFLGGDTGWHDRWTDTSVVDNT
jgi:uncharacterized RDD family membrane protein YckC